MSEIINVDPNELLNVASAAEYMNCSPREVCRRIMMEQLAASKILNKWVIQKRACNYCLNCRREKENFKKIREQSS